MLTIYTFTVGPIRVYFAIYSTHQNSETTLLKTKITNLMKEFHFYIWFYEFSTGLEYKQKSRKKQKSLEIKEVSPEKQRIQYLQEWSTVRQHMITRRECSPNFAIRAVFNRGPNVF